MMRLKDDEKRGGGTIYYYYYDNDTGKLHGSKEQPPRKPHITHVWRVDESDRRTGYNFILEALVIADDIEMLKALTQFNNMTVGDSLIYMFTQPKSSILGRKMAFFMDAVHDHDIQDVVEWLRDYEAPGGPQSKYDPDVVDEQFPPFWKQ